MINVRNFNGYVATGITYRQNVHHHFRMAVDVSTNRYSVWLKFANEPEVLIASSFAFRNAASQLETWMVRTDESSPAFGFEVCNVRVP